MSDTVIVAVVTGLLGVGGTGGVGLLVNAWRAHKKGKIEDDGTLIERLDKENKDLSDKLIRSRKFEQLYMTQAFKYRRQIARIPGIEPDDMDELWDTGTPRIESHDDPIPG